MTDTETTARHGIRPGQHLPPLTLEVTRTTLAKVVAGTRDLYPIHHDQEFARAAGARDTFVNTMWYQGLLGRYATDWGGPNSFVRKLSFEMRAVNCPGDTLTVHGRVLRLTSADAATLVDLDIRIDNQEQRDSVTAHLTLELMPQPPGAVAVDAG
jgi:acyl dehydratase